MYLVSNEHRYEKNGNWIDLLIHGDNVCANKIKIGKEIKLKNNLRISIKLMIIT